MDALNRILGDAENVLKGKKRVIVAIDGKSGTGKSHLARLIGACARVSIIHVDDFFLPEEKRTKERYETPGGNVDSERFISDVLLPLKSGMPFSYRPFDCASMRISERIVEVDKPFILIEGVYSLHPAFRESYDLGYVLDAPYDSRLDRIKSRTSDKKKIDAFTSFWMPLEDKYFNFFDFSSYPLIDNSPE